MASLAKYFFAQNWGRIFRRWKSVCKDTESYLGPFVGFYNLRLKLSRSKVHLIGFHTERGHAVNNIYSLLRFLFCFLFHSYF